MSHDLDADEGFLNSLIEMLESDRSSSVFDELDLFFKEDPIMRPFPLVPDPNQLSIPSEPVVRGTFMDRVDQSRKGTASSFAKLSSEAATMDIGNSIVLSSILKQLDFLPSVRSENNEFSFPEIDITRFFDNEVTVSRGDIKLGNLRRMLKKAGFLDSEI